MKHMSLKKKETAKNFKEYFAKNFDNKMPKSKWKIADYLINKILIFSLIRSMKKKYKILQVILQTTKQLAQTIYQLYSCNNLKKNSVPLSLIINLSFKTGIFPIVCKITHAIPIYKKGEQPDWSN